MFSLMCVSFEGKIIFDERYHNLASVKHAAQEMLALEERVKAATGDRYVPVQILVRDERLGKFITDHPSLGIQQVM